MNDKEWLVLLEKSPQEALSTLIEQYGNLVYTIVYSKLKSCADRYEIEDCVSDVFVEIIQNTDKFTETKGSLKGFVSIIAKRTAINAYKRITSKYNTTEYINDETAELSAKGNTPDEETENKIFRERLWLAVKSLGEPDAEIIICQYFYDMTSSQIAKKLGMSVFAVQKRSQRARERIRRILENENYL